MRNFQRIALTLLALPLSVSANVFDDFNDGNDTGWTRFNPFQALGAAYSFPSGGYRMVSPASPNPVSFGPARMGSFQSENYTTNFTVSVDLVNWNSGLGDMVMGVIGRATSVGGGTTNGYVAAVETDGNFYLVRTAGEVPTTLTSVDLPTLDINKDYRISLSGAGSGLTANLFNITDNVSLSTLNWTDATYTSGIGGILVFDSSAAANQSVDATFDNYVGVPEPASAGMLVLGAVSLLGRRNRKSARA